VGIDPSRVCGTTVASFLRRKAKYRSGEEFGRTGIRRASSCVAARVRASCVVRTDVDRCETAMARHVDGPDNGFGENQSHSPRVDNHGVRSWISTREGPTDPRDPVAGKCKKNQRRGPVLEGGGRRGNIFFHKFLFFSHGWKKNFMFKNRGLLGYTTVYDSVFSVHARVSCTPLKVFWTIPRSHQSHVPSCTHGYTTLQQRGASFHEMSTVENCSSPKKIKGGGCRAAPRRAGPPKNAPPNSMTHPGGAGRKFRKFGVVFVKFPFPTTTGWFGSFSNEFPGKNRGNENEVKIFSGADGWEYFTASGALGRSLARSFPWRLESWQT